MPRWPLRLPLRLRTHQGHNILFRQLAMSTSFLSLLYVGLLPRLQCIRAFVRYFADIACFLPNFLSSSSFFCLTPSFSLSSSRGMALGVNVHALFIIDPAFPWELFRFSPLWVPFKGESYNFRVGGKRLCVPAALLQSVGHRGAALFIQRRHHML